MAYFIGTDEAGYGPNLGPLVISATLWHVADQDVAEVDWYERLQGVIAPRVPRRGACGGLPVAMADSKALEGGVVLPDHVRGNGPTGSSL